MKPKRKARAFRCINDFMKAMFPQTWAAEQVAKQEERPLTEIVADMREVLAKRGKK